MRNFLARFAALLMLALLGVLVGCSASEDSIRRTLEKHPELVLEAIEKSGPKFQQTLQKMQQDQRRRMQEEQEGQAKKAMEEDIANPKKPKLEGGLVRGNANAEAVLVVYSDFQCPYCKQGFETSEALRAKYGDKLKVVFKHLPLKFHPMARPAAMRFEAIAKQSTDKAWAFHDALFKAQQRMGEGEKFLDDAARQVGADVNRMKAEMRSADIAKKIDADTEEASGFGIRGTPGFVLNGVVIRGAFPIAFFDEVLAKKPKAN